MAGNLMGNAQVESNLAQIQANMPLGSVSDFVNQLVLTNTSSFRTPSGSGSRVRSDLRQFVAPRLVVHSLWPSLQVTHGPKVTITSICSIELARLSFCRVDRRVPNQGRDSISFLAFQLISDIWIPLVDGVSLGSFMNYCWFKHIRFHALSPSSNVWDRSLVWAESIIGNNKDVIDDLRNHLTNTMKYEPGKFYFCRPFVDVVTRYFFNKFGGLVNVIFFTHDYTRYWKEVRILLDNEMTHVLSYPPSCLFKVKDKDTFFFE